MTIQNLTSRLMPGGLVYQGIILSRKARLLIQVLLISYLPLLSLLIFYVFTDVVSKGIFLITSIMTVSVPGLLIYFKQTGKQAIVIHTFFTFAFTLLTAVSITSGGINSINLVWYITLPMLAYLLSDRITGMVWVLISSIIIFCMLGIHLTFPEYIIPSISSPVFTFLSLTLNFITILPILVSYKQSMKAVHLDMDAANTKLRLQQQSILISNEAIQKQAEEIRAQKRFLEQKDSMLQGVLNDVEVKMTVLTDSIRYAKDIQEAMLVQDQERFSYFSDHFLVYKPKDIVSGDFYWMTNKMGYQFVSVVDCTGHGVPGAFMSIIGHNILDHIVNIDGMTDTDIILTELNIRVRKTLKQDQTNNLDGMDVCMCRLKKMGNGSIELAFTGAKRPLFIIRNGELIEMKGDRKTIGGLLQTAKLFTSSIVHLSHGDKVYLTSDGVIDQPNKERKKFGSKRLRGLLNTINDLPMEQQGNKLEEILQLHKGFTEIRDDITVLGVQV